MKKKIFLAVVVLVVAIQFIRPARNEGEIFSATDITKSVAVPDNVKSILVKACADCHSNKTVYPWYFNIQPFGWWLADHVDEGKREVNFSEFDTYKLRRKIKKFKEIVEQVKEGEMPLDSYTWVHRDAKLSQEEKDALINWAETSRAAIDTVKVLAK